KRQREHAALIAGLKQKDKVVTQGGLIGEIRHVGEQDVTVRISDGVDVRIVKTMIASVQGR
ncbi:MAG: preprotein translocase subunit YajC, partial [Hyphomicrobiales bacterium]|nr:preprotein translocase subunit YajC [Hyphomicrobiales bacterium]